MMIRPGGSLAESASHSESLQTFFQTAKQYSDASDPHDPFARFAASWAERAAVKGVEPHVTKAFDPDRYLAAVLRCCRRLAHVGVRD